MLTAAQARSKAQNDLVIFNEVRDIELSILTASADGDYEVTLTDTAMTTASTYYNVWRGNTSDRAKEKQMAVIVQYFADLGYTIDRKTNPTTGNTFSWTIYW
jgi:mevalonate pyrophosphate decarboxylase